MTEDDYKDEWTPKAWRSHAPMACDEDFDNDVQDELYRQPGDSRD